MSRSPARLTQLTRIAPLLALALALTGCPGGAGGGSGEISQSAIAQASTLAGLKERGKLRVGMEPTFWPFEYKPDSGEVEGFDVDLARELAKELGVELEIVEARFDGLFASLVSKKVDIVMSGVTATLGRATNFSFSKPYFLTGLCILANAKSAIRSVHDLKQPGVRVVVKKTTTGFLWAQANLPDAKLAQFDEEAACALEVAQGRADAFIYDQLSVWKHHTLNKAATRAIMKPFTFEPYGIMFRQGDPDFARFLDQFVDTLERDGRLQKLRQKHFGEIIEADPSIFEER